VSILIIPADVLRLLIRSTTGAYGSLTRDPGSLKSEDLVGAGLKRAFEEGLVKREDVFIQTKCVTQSQDSGPV
jgi:diketogulonate reductase-like aldo/keto reductase